MYRAVGVVLLVVYLLLVGWVTLRPLDVPWVSAANLHPLAGIRADLALGPREATMRIGAGLLLLAPLGVLLPLAGGRLAVSPLGSLVRTVTAAALLSLGIELVQTGVPGQVVDIDSLLLNPLGVAVVHLAVVPATRARLRRRARGGSPPCAGAFPEGAPEGAGAAAGASTAGAGSDPRRGRIGPTGPTGPTEATRTDRARETTGTLPTTKVGIAP